MASDSRRRPVSSKARFLSELEDAIASPAQAPLALVVDEAQSLPYELLEEIRLLTNLDAGRGRPWRSPWSGSPSWPRAWTIPHCGS